MPQHWQAMHADCALHSNYVATHNQKLHFICVTMPDLENPSRKLPMGHDVF